MQDSNRRGFFGALGALAAVPLMATEKAPEEISEGALFDLVHRRLESQITKEVQRWDGAGSPHSELVRMNLYNKTVSIDKKVSNTSRQAVLSMAVESIAGMINARRDNVSFAQEIPGTVGFSGIQYKTLRGSVTSGKKVHLRIIVLEDKDSDQVELYDLAVLMGRDNARG